MCKGPEAEGCTLERVKESWGEQGAQLSNEHGGNGEVT